MAKNSNFSILVDVDFDASQIKRALDEASGGVAGASKGVKDLNTAAGDAGLTFQQLNAIMRQSVDVLSSMADQVFNLDTALTELNMAHSYRKVTVK